MKRNSNRPSMRTIIIHAIILMIYTHIPMNLATYATCNNDCGNMECTDSDDDCTLICNGNNGCFGLTYTCSGSNRLCNVQCLGYEACKSLTVISNGNTLINCADEKACFSATISITGNGNDVYGNVTCDGTQACESATISLYGSSPNNHLNVFCADSDDPDYPPCYLTNVHCHATSKQCEAECETTTTNSCWDDNNKLHCHNNGIGTECKIVNYPLVGFQYGVTFLPSNDPTTTQPPSSTPSVAPTSPPSNAPSVSPTQPPTNAPSFAPSKAPSNNPSVAPTSPPSNAPSFSPTNSPSAAPSFSPTESPSLHPSNDPTNHPTNHPSIAPSRAPSVSPSLAPTMTPSVSPTQPPSSAPSQPPTKAPSYSPTLAPSFSPSLNPSIAPSQPPTKSPSVAPSASPTRSPSYSPSDNPTNNPSTAPSNSPTISPTTAPSFAPSSSPTAPPSNHPTAHPTRHPSTAPSTSPSHSPSTAPTLPPSVSPVQPPTNAPSRAPSKIPSNPPTVAPSISPTVAPSRTPSQPPSKAPSFSSSVSPTRVPSYTPTANPIRNPSKAPLTQDPTDNPSTAPSHSPTVSPTHTPSLTPSISPTFPPSNNPTSYPTNHPSTTPSISPSNPPSNVPSVSPSASPVQPPTNAPSHAPTTVPSNAPTLAPSLAPSHAPTKAPSLTPSVSPTRVPSYSPSSNPTNHPSNAPSINPSFSPTHAPTRKPTLEPTTCVDYANYAAVDGEDSVSNMRYPQQISYDEQRFPSGVVIQKYINISMTDEYIECSDTTSDICFIGCYNASQCAGTSITAVPNVELEQIKVICSVKESCSSLMINLTEVEAKVENLYILCNAHLACDGAQVILDAPTTTNVTIECVESFSCNDLTVRVLPAADAANASLHLEITCYSDHSCDNMTIDSDDAPNISIQLNARRHSDSITIINHFWQNVTVQCGLDDDHRYIQYETRPNLLDRYQVLQLARDEYDTGRLPCENITVLCGKNECEYNYKLPFDSTDILKDDARPSCYWIDIAKDYKATCEGTCGDAIEYYPYHKTVHLDLSFTSETTDSDGVIVNVTHPSPYTVCNKHFASDNATKDSLHNIDVVFEGVLSGLIIDDSSIIHKIVKPPQSIVTEIRCNENKKQDPMVRLKMSVTVEAEAEEEDDVDEMFADDSEFVTESVKLLSKLFGISLAIIAVNVNPPINLDLPLIIGIGGGALFVICMILLFVYVSNRKRRREREKKTIYVENAMVIFVGIATYESEKPPSDPEIEGFFSNLPAIKCDRDSVHKLFGDELNYRIFPTELKLQWTFDEMMEFLQEKSDELESNLDLYDGLVVIYSGHGIPDHIVTSDYRKIKKTKIHRIFSKNKPKNRKIPRLFMFDCCDGQQKHELGSVRAELQNEASQRERAKSSVHAQAPDLSGLSALHAPQAPRESLGGPQWLHDEENPDYRLALMVGANEGFQSRLHIKKGSFAITSFTQKMIENVSNGSKKWLDEICRDMQTDLYSRGFQLPMATFTANMEYLKFRKSAHANKNDMEVVHSDTTDMNELEVAADGGGKGDAFAVKDQRQKPN